jgi:hypothetical protein
MCSGSGSRAEREKFENRNDLGAAYYDSLC